MKSLLLTSLDPATAVFVPKKKIGFPKTPQPFVKLMDVALDTCWYFSGKIVIKQRAKSNKDKKNTPDYTFSGLISLFVEVLFVVNMTHTVRSQLLLKVCRPFVLMFNSDGGMWVYEV